MKELFFSATDLRQFGLQQEEISLLGERTIVVKKWNWDYSLAHTFQRHALDLLQSHPQMRILICCSHPRVLTNGRGLQKPRKGEILNLVNFIPENFESLPYPLYKIERGGGLTFHHPGQFIFYPIVRLNPKTLSLSKMIDDIFDFSIEVLQEWGLDHLTHENQLLGLWRKNQKIASMGIAIEKLTTFHGMALNLVMDREMITAMEVLNPCGLSSHTYSAVDQFINLAPNGIEEFSDSFLQRIDHAWK
jgi:lipoyl(octanoyl) transferase